MKAKRFATEAGLCAAFISWVKSEAGRHRHGVKVPTWTPYAETAGWDILLVAVDGTQIGVQAKQRFNMKVLQQTIPDTWDSWHDEGPDYRAILIPESDRDIEHLCGALGITVFHPEHYDDFGPPLTMESWNACWHYWSPRERCRLPEFVPDVAAGASGPIQLTQWKVGALRLLAMLEIQGHVTRQDFRTAGIDPRRWMGATGWLIPGAQPGQWIRGPGLDFDKQHPTVYAEVLAEQRAKSGSAFLMASPGPAVQVAIEVPRP